MKLDAFEASSSARPRISDGLPIRPSGMTAFHSASASGEVGPPPPRLVLNGPGAIAFTRTFHRARSWAACLVKLITAALAIVYEYGVHGPSRSPGVDRVVMMLPDWGRFVCGGGA